MNTKLKAIFITLLATLSTASAVILWRFTSWDDLTTKSPDIIIARCVTTPDTDFNVDGMNWADIEVLSVLKGDTKLGMARMVSQYLPHQGERFLAFSTFQSDERWPAYNATEDYRVVSLGLHFLNSELTGKPLPEQIQIVLRRRLEDVNRDLERATEEKKRLEGGLKK